jgi:hypothetical protein
LLGLLFSDRTVELRLDLRKLHASIHESMVNVLISVLRTRPCPALTRVELFDGTSYCNVLTSTMHVLCSALLASAPNLSVLHLPVVTNVGLRHISDMPRLVSLSADRTYEFDRRGLWHLCHPMAKAKVTLRRLRLGVFKQHHFNELDVSRFFACVSQLTSFSLMEVNSPSRHLDYYDFLANFDLYFSEKIMPCTLVRLGIVHAEMDHATDEHRDRGEEQHETRCGHGHEQSELEREPHEHGRCQRCEDYEKQWQKDHPGHEELDRKRPPLERDPQQRESVKEQVIYRCRLQEMKIVDCRLKPEHLLTACPDLRRLYVECQDPFAFCSPAWFGHMLTDVKWAPVAAKLTHLDLDLTLPATHEQVWKTYSLPPDDFDRLISSVPNLTVLRLCGAGRDASIPLLSVLRHCPKLVSLFMDKTNVDVPDNYDVIHANSVNR